MFLVLYSYVLLLLFQAAANDLAKATEREKELESVCKEQAAKIEQLNNLVIILFTSLKLYFMKIPETWITFDSLTFYR